MAGLDNANIDYICRNAIMTPAVIITGIRLVTTGKPGAPDESIEVHAEVSGEWRLVISELKDGPISHIVEPAGIRSAPVVQ